MSNKNANIGKAAKAEVPQTQAAEVATAPPKKVAHVVITPHMLEKLKTGPRVKVIVGLEGQRYIAIEAAFVNLLAHISPFAKKALVVDKAPVLSIPGGSKDEIMWIYKYAMAGQVQTTDKIEDMGFDKLITLYSHCQVLEYTEPMAKIEKQIRNRLNDEIPAPRVIIEIGNYIPSLKDLLVRSVGRVVLHPWVFNYDPYTDLADENAEFGKALDEIVEANLHKRIEAGEKYYNRDKKDSSLRLSDFLYMSIENGTVDNKHEEAFAKYDQLQYFNSVKCFNCGDAGHIANDCTQPKRPRGPKCYTCQEQGHVARDCPYAYNPPTCYKCNQVGHIARNCKAGADEAANDGPRPRNTQGRNKNFRRAQRERGSIEVNTNGEGIRTCDREVRPGEVTRTGLQI